MDRDRIRDRDTAMDESRVRVMDRDTGMAMVKTEGRAQAQG